jgi:hypothetical protein
MKSDRPLFTILPTFARFFKTGQALPHGTEGSKKICPVFTFHFLRPVGTLFFADKIVIGENP